MMCFRFEAKKLESLSKGRMSLFLLIASIYILAPLSFAFAQALPPVVDKRIVPNTIFPAQPALVTITLINNSPGVSTLTSDFVDNFPAGVVTVNQATTTCVGGPVPSIITGASSVTLRAGVGIPANGSCTITVAVTAILNGTYVNDILPGTLATNTGANANNAFATLNVLPPEINPIVRKRFKPSRIEDCGPSTLEITITNPFCTTFLTAPLRDIFPANLLTFGNPSTTCRDGVVRLLPDRSGVELTEATLPANSSCTVRVGVIGKCTGLFTNVIHAGALQTTNGPNLFPATATLDYCCNDNVELEMCAME